MIGGLATLILFSIFAVIQTLGVSQRISLTEAALGENVTLSCKVLELKPGLFYWFKMVFGHVVQTIVLGSFEKLDLQGQFNNSKFNVTKVGNTYFLTIQNVRKEDEATYLCQAGTAYTMEFFNETHVAVNDPNKKLKALFVKQYPEREQVPQGSTATLQCSLLSGREEPDGCPGERHMFWYRSGSEQDPGIIYTGNFSCDDQERRSCVSHLSKPIRNHSDTGTYYCAVVACGKILFGKGTTLETKQEFPLIIVLGTLLACMSLLSIALIVTKIMQKQVCEHCKGDPSASNYAERVRSSRDQQSNLNGEDVNYVALDFASTKAKRSKNKRNSSEDCTYSSIKDYH